MPVEMDASHRFRRISSESTECFDAKIDSYNGDRHDDDTRNRIWTHVALQTLFHFACTSEYLSVQLSHHFLEKLQFDLVSFCQMQA